MSLSWLARGREHLPAGTGWLSPAEAAWAGGMRFAKRRTEFLIALDRQAGPATGTVPGR